MKVWLILFFLGIQLGLHSGAHGSNLCRQALQYFSKTPPPNPLTNAPFRIESRDLFNSSPYHSQSPLNFPLEMNKENLTLALGLIERASFERSGDSWLVALFNQRKPPYDFSWQGSDNEFSLRDSFTSIRLYLPQKTLETPRDLSVYLWNFYLELYSLHRREIAQKYIQPDLVERLRSSYRVQDLKLLTEIAQLDLKIYRILEALQKYDPEFNPLALLDPGLQRKLFNYILRKDPTQRHWLNQEDFELTLLTPNASIALEKQLKESYRHALLYRRGMRCAFQASTLFFILSHTIHIYTHPKEVIAQTQKALEQGQQIMVTVANSEKLAQSEDKINKRFQELLQQDAYRPETSAAVALKK